MSSKKRIAIIGGGAAGYFSAIAAAQCNREAEVVIFEATRKPLAKVLVSGGGRCNVTHHCFDAGELIKNYPRGSRELRGPFSRFQPEDTVRWFESHGVRLKVEPDGRMFPTTDNSETIANCLQDVARKHNVRTRLGAKIRKVQQVENGAESSFSLSLDTEVNEIFDHLIIATGGGRAGFELASSLGHSIVSPVPSLFTFEISDPRLEGLSGISFPVAKLMLLFPSRKVRFSQAGPLLITHWGVSGPAVIKLSALAARELFETDYQAKLKINFLPTHTDQSLMDLFSQQKQTTPKKELRSVVFEGVAKRYWHNLLTILSFKEGLIWADVSNKQFRELTGQLVDAEFEIIGKGVFKEEFVTCGGVSLKEVDFRTMQSKICPGLFFAGEVLDIDGLTGGFNFQAAWTTGWIAGSNICGLKF